MSGIRTARFFIETMKTIGIQYFKSSFGELILGEFDGKLCMCDWRYRKTRTAIDKRLQKGLNAGFREKESSLFDTVKQQLDEYFSASRKTFTVPLLMVGTDFQKQIWNELRKIPFGETDSYLGLSQKINNPKAVRAVAAANGANAIAIFVPCHRIIGIRGDFVGYAGGISTKKKLLQLESSVWGDSLKKSANFF